MGILILGIAGIYLLISIAVVLLVVRYARNKGAGAKRWGWGAALVMWLIPFWDWLPTAAVHQYYCATEAGVWVNKTFDQWKQENPDVNLVLDNRHPTVYQKEKSGLTEIHQLNQRFNWLIKHRRKIPILPLWQKDQLLIDQDNGDVLEQYIDFSTGYENVMTNGPGGNRFKVWLSREMCDRGANRAIFGKQIDKIYTYAKGDRK